MIEPNRDVEFWEDVANHPAVSPHVFMGLDPVSLAPLILMDRCVPLASENGGLIFAPLDPHGMIYELHTLYRPEGWGREVAGFAKHCFDQMFLAASLIVTHEQEGSKHTRPPLSYGWKSCGEYCYTELPKRLRLWSLTREDFYASPVGRKLKCR